MNRKEMVKQVDEYIGNGGHPMDVYEALAEAMYATRVHLENDWQDHAMAKVWERLAKRANKEAAHSQKELRGMGYK